MFENEMSEIQLDLFLTNFQSTLYAQQQQILIWH